MENKSIKLFTGVALLAYVLHIFELWIFGFSSTFLKIQTLYARYKKWFPREETAHAVALFSISFLFLFIVFLVLQSGKPQGIAMTLIGLFLILGGYHFWEAITSASYSSGAVTGILLAGLGIVLIKESFKILIKKS